MHAFCIEFWALWMEILSDSFLHICISLASVTTRMLHQKAEKWRALGAKTPHSMTVSCLVAAIWTECVNWGFCSSVKEIWALLGFYKLQNGNLLEMFQSSEEASWWSQIPQYCRSARSCLTMIPFTQPRFLYWRNTFTHNTLWQKPEPSGWLCENIGYCSVFLQEMLLWETEREREKRDG